MKNSKKKKWIFQKEIKKEDNVIKSEEANTQEIDIMPFDEIDIDAEETLKNKKDMKTSLNETIEIINNFTDKRKEELDKIDYVIGISRGGLIPAAWLATKIIKPLIAAYINKQDVVFFDRTSWIEDKNVLIIDDICRSGKTLYKISKLIEESNPKSIKFFTIFDIPSLRKEEYEEYLNNKLKSGEILDKDIDMPWDFD